MRLFALFTLLIFLTAPLASALAQEEQETAAAGTMYFELDPAFVLNYGNGTSGRLKFLRAELTLRLSTQGTVIGVVNQHMPAIRHAIIMYLSKQSNERINDASQRDSLRNELRDEVQATLAAVGEASGVEDLLFNAFIVQR